MIHGMDTGFPVSAELVEHSGHAYPNALATRQKTSVAVGTALAGGPPRGSVREGLLHTALTSGSDDPWLGRSAGMPRVVRPTIRMPRLPGSVSGASKV